MTEFLLFSEGALSRLDTVAVGALTFVYQLISIGILWHTANFSFVNDIHQILLYTTVMLVT